MSRTELYLEPIINPIPFRQFKRYTKEEIKLIKELYPDISNKEIAHRLGRKQRMIGQVGIRYGFKKSKEYMNTNPGAFKKELIPWNKGLKGFRPSKRTEFKAGHLPANTKYDGCLSLRKKHNGEKYYYIRISQAKWVLYQRYLWEQKHGSILKGMLIIFKDKNFLNFNSLFLFSLINNIFAIEI